MGVSLFCRSDPSTDGIKKMLNKIKTLESTVSTCNPSAEIICSGFSQLTVVYECLENLIKTNVSETLSVSRNQTMKWTDELLDVSVKFLDICSNANDVICQTKQNLRDLMFDLRRTRGSSIESIIVKYIVLRKKLKKDLKGSVASLKKVDSMISSGCPIMVDLENFHFMWVFREVTALSTVIFRLMIEFLCMPILKRKPMVRWINFSRFLSNSKVVPQENANAYVNEMQCLDAALFSCSTNDKQEFIQIVPKKLEALEDTLDAINSEMEVTFRRLIAARASILDVLSFY